AGLALWQRCPSTLPRLIQWAEIQQDCDKRDKSRDRILVYKNIPDPRPDTLYPVALRLHGFLECFCIERLGNWTGDIYLQCHVFEKVRDTTILIPTAFLKLDKCSNRSRTDIFDITPADDPKDAYRMIQEHWNVCEVLPIGEVSADNKLVLLDKLLLTQGDFVEVGAELDFVVGRDKASKPILRAYLSCTHITHL
ncbi:hypothetical protein C8R48DRAFT_555219, partial [Suillus tomentosus]